MKPMIVAASVIALSLASGCAGLSQGAGGIRDAFRNTVGLSVAEKVGEFNGFNLERVALKDSADTPLLAVAVIPATSGIALMAVDGNNLKKLLPGAGSADVIAQTEGAQIQAPSAVVVSVRHWLVLSETTGTAYKVNRDTGAVVQTVTGLNRPRGVLELSDGSMLIAESGSGQIVRIAETNSAEKIILVKGLNRPSAMAQSSNGVFVSESGANQILKLDPITGRYSVLATNLQNPQGIAVTSSGRIAVFEATGSSLLSIDQVSGASAVRAQGLPIVGSDAKPVYISAARDEALYLTAPNDSKLYRLVRK
jgi:glucose/arabinose dehydrogenase